MVTWIVIVNGFFVFEFIFFSFKFYFCFEVFNFFIFFQFFDFDIEVKFILEVLVGKTVE